MTPRGVVDLKLQAIVDRIVELVQLTEEFEIEPSKAELKENAGELQNEKANSRKMAQPLMSSRDSFSTQRACVMMREVRKQYIRGPVENMEAA